MEPRLERSGGPSGVSDPTLPTLVSRSLFPAVLLLLAAGTAAAENLCLNRPVSVSSTAWAATPAEFAVDGQSDTGWRAADGDDQWIEVDLQGECRVSALRLVSEATREDRPYLGDRLNTTGNELLSSYATAYTIQVSEDDRTWTDIFHTAEGKGGTEEIPLRVPVSARFVRLRILKRSSPAPVGLNEFQVQGTCAQDRPAAEGWTTRRLSKKAKDLQPLALANDGTVPILSGWDLICQDWLETSDAAVLSRPGIDTSKWYDATVPGTVLGTLVDQGVFPDPAYGLANLKVPEALCRRVWWYRCDFAIPAGFDRSAGRQVWLEMDGVHHKAEIWLNGTKLGDLPAFRRGRFNLTAQLQPTGANVLAVRVYPPPFPGSPGDKGTDGKAWVNSIQLGLDEPTFLCASGWDWMPAVRDRATGILDAVRLRSTGPVLLGDPQVETRLPVPSDPSLAHVLLTVPVSNPGPEDRRVTVTAAITPVRPGVSTDPAPFSQDITVPAGGSVDARFTPEQFPTLAISHPALWWPNGYGRPDLHVLTLQAAVGGVISDRRSSRFGMRDLQARAFGLDPVVPDKPTDTVIDFPAASARHVRIDCRQRTSKYGYSLWNFSVFNTQAAGDDLALHRQVTASSHESGKDPELACDGDSRTRWSSLYSGPQWIAVDLGGTRDINRVSLQWEFAAAKNYVIQVSDDGQTWRDIKAMNDSNSGHPSQLQISVNGVRVFCRGGNWGYDELLRRGGQARLDTAVRLQRESNYTMIRNWTGAITRPEFYEACDENGILVFNDFWCSSWGGTPPLPNSDRHQVFLDTAQDTILRYRSHPSIALWCGSNESTPPSEINDGLRKLVARYDGPRVYIPDSASSPVSGRGPYRWVDPRSYDGTGFHTELGMPTVPVADSMRRLAGDQPSWPIGAVWNYHDWCPNGGQSSDGYREAIRVRLGEAKDLDDFCAKAQFVNYENMRAIYEAYNHHLWNDASAALIWMSHPAWMSTTWQTYDYDFEVNGSYFGARKACEPVHIQAMLSDGSVDAVNQTAEAIPGVTVTATSYDLNGRRRGSVQMARADLPASGTVPIFKADWPADAPALHLLRLEMRNQDGKLLSENTYWRYKNAGDMQALNALPPSSLGVKAGVRVEGGRTLVTASVTNAGATVVPMVTLSLRRAGDHGRVLPAFHSDGDFWLLPGETRVVTIECATSDLHGQPTAVKVSGYRVPDVTASAF